MKRTTLTLLVVGLFAAAPAALAQMAVSGSVTGGVILTDVKSNNPFRFEEYRDLRSGATLGADIRGESYTNFLRFFGENIGRDDQFMELKGGQYGVFKYSLTNNNIIHNLTSNAITPFSGIGTNNLTFPGALGATPTLNTATWSRFDYSVKHENYGGTFELQSSAASPFYFRATANQKETRGIKPFGQAGTSPGGPNYELPQIVDYSTSDASAEAGYATKTSQYSLNFSWSKFKDNNDFFTWRNPSITNAASTITTERATIAADNALWKLGANAMWKQLPMSSTLALRGTYSRNTNSLPIASTGTVVTGTTGRIVNMNASSNTFDGDVVSKSLSASLTSQLAKSLDSRVYWNWTDKKNNSTAIVFRPVNATTLASTQSCDLNPVTGASLTTCSNELFHLKKDNLGVDLQYRVNPQNKLSGGWDYLHTERERLDFEKTKDNKYYVEWKNNSFDLVSAKIKYQHMERDADFRLGDLNAALSSNNLFNKYLKRFDLAGNNQDLIKLVLDSSPVEFLDLGAELILKSNRYKDVTLGRKSDDREEIYFTASYGDPKKFRVSAFFDFETTKYDSDHYQGTPNAATFPAAVNATTFLWNGKVKDKNYIIGLGADWPYSERLRFKGSWTWQQTNGTVDFAANIATAVIVNIPAYDTFRKHTLDLRGTYAMNKNFDLNFGFAHENYKYTDAQMDNYNYTPLTGTSQNLLSGAYAKPSYNANIVYLSLKYMFQ